MFVHSSVSRGGWLRNPVLISLTKPRPLPSPFPLPPALLSSFPSSVPPQHLTSLESSSRNGWSCRGVFSEGHGGGRERWRGRRRKWTGESLGVRGMEGRECGV